MTSHQDHAARIASLEAVLGKLTEKSEVPAPTFPLQPRQSHGKTPTAAGVFGLSASAAPQSGCLLLSVDWKTRLGTVPFLLVVPFDCSSVSYLCPMHWFQGVFFGGRSEPRLQEAITQPPPCCP